MRAVPVRVEDEQLAVRRPVRLAAAERPRRHLPGVGCRRRSSRRRPARLARRAPKAICRPSGDQPAARRSARWLASCGSSRDVRPVGVHEADAAVAGSLGDGCTWHWKAICLPSGDQTGTARQMPPAGRLPALMHPFPGGSYASLVRCEPSLETASISSVSQPPPQPLRSIRWNTICVPSGDQSGSTSATGSLGVVIWRTPEPSGSAVKIAPQECSGVEPATERELPVLARRRRGRAGGRAEHAQRPRRQGRKRFISAGDQTGPLSPNLFVVSRTSFFPSAFTT